MDNVERRTYLVRHVLHELRLLFTGLACQQGGLFQFLSALLGCLFCLLRLPDVLADAPPHLTEAVLQLAYQVGALAGWQRLLVVSVAYLSQFSRQQS